MSSASFVTGPNSIKEPLPREYTASAYDAITLAPEFFTALRKAV